MEIEKVTLKIPLTLRFPIIHFCFTFNLIYIYTKAKVFVKVKGHNKMLHINIFAPLSFRAKVSAWAGFSGFCFVNSADPNFFTIFSIASVKLRIKSFN